MIFDFLTRECTQPWLNTILVVNDDNKYYLSTKQKLHPKCRRKNIVKGIKFGVF